MSYNFAIFLLGAAGEIFDGWKNHFIYKANEFQIVRGIYGALF
jgi:hypothetical protein